MARRNRDRIAELVDLFEPRLRDAFIAAVEDLRNGADLAAIVAALERGDIQGAITAMHLDSAAFADLDNALADAFKAGGNVTVNGLPTVTTSNGTRLVFRFDARNPRAEQWLRTYSSELVTAIIEDQREAIRAALEDGQKRGINPRQTALDIVGRYDAQAKKRVGGVIGLTSAQEEYATNALAELLSGDPERLRSYLGRELRDRRYDAIALKAIRDEKPVSATDAARMQQRYKDRLLKLRGDTIARTETLTALHQGQHEALEQIAAKGNLPRSAVSRIWRDAGDSRVRHTHAAMSGQKRSIDQPFQSPSGALLRFPGDPRAPASETVNCRCYTESSVDFLHGIK